MFTLFVLNVIFLGIVCGFLIKMIKDTRAEMVVVKKHVERLQARLDGITQNNENE